MYKIKPENLVSFAQDKTIKLPRFQRKQTWDEKKNFELYLSIFNGYPLGVTIINVDKKSKWLLDGRQRRSAIIEMLDDPESIYLASQKFIKFKNNDQPREVEEKFWKAVEDFTEEDEEGEEFSEKNTIKEANQIMEYVDEEDEFEFEFDEPLVETLASEGLDFLCEIIVMSHNKTKSYTGFTKPFFFSSKLRHELNLDYIDIQNNGVEKVNGKKLKAFIGYFLSDKDIDEVTCEDFFEYMDKSKSNKLLEKETNKNWEQIKARMRVIQQIDQVLRSADIGIIEVENIKPNDAQKIFNIINTGGTTLTAAEILSAKPSWNKEIPNPSAASIEASEKIYKKMDIKQVDKKVVKWDLPATLIDRLNPNYSSIIFKNELKIENEITLGFQIVSGVFQGGISKKDIEELSGNPIVRWNIDIDKLIARIDSCFRTIRNHSYFKFFIQWKMNVQDLLSDATMLNFILLLLKVDEKNSDDNILLQKNALILIDRMVYEYTLGNWKGSSDSKVSRNIKEFGNQGNLFEPIEEERWISLLNEIFENGKIGDDIVTQAKLTPLLYHVYCLSEIGAPQTEYDKFEVDHIYSKAVLRNSTKQLNVDELFNLCLLNKEINGKKREQTLIQIDDSADKNEIQRLTQINIDDFKKYSDVSNLDDLKELRKKFFFDAFEVKRKKIFNN